MKPKCTLEEFQKSVSKHEMTVIRDEGVDRHLRFRKSTSSDSWFDVITWGGRLYIGGDCGTYVFARLPDMFKFFRGDEDRINPGYWEEKVESSDRNGGTQAFEWETFLEDVKSSFDSSWYIDDLEEGFDEVDRKHHTDHIDKRTACWEAVQEALDDTQNDEYGACGFIRNFNHENWYFKDWEHDSKEFTSHFLWNCYAIVWAIDKYDASKLVATKEQ